MLYKQTLAMVVMAVSVAAPVQWTFESDKPGELPSGWKTRGGSAKGIYSVVSEKNGNHFLAARSHADGVQLGLAIKIRARDYPTLSWRWRVLELPRGADETRAETMDSAAAVYVAFGSQFFPRILKYVWSTSASKGTMIRHPHSRRTVIIVIDSGDQGIGQWNVISRSLLDDYRAAFGGDAATIVAIGVKTDSDSTSSTAAADYDDFVFSSPASSQVIGELR